MSLIKSDVKKGTCLLIAGGDIRVSRKKCRRELYGLFNIFAPSGRKRKRFTRWTGRNYSWIESLNCIGKGPSNLTKAGIPIANFSTLLLSESNQCTLCSARKLTNSGKKKPVPETGWKGEGEVNSDFN